MYMFIILEIRGPVGPYNRDPCSTYICKGRCKNRKSRNIGTMSQLGLAPPPSDLWDIFEFGTFLKDVDFPPLTKLGHF